MDFTFETHVVSFSHLPMPPLEPPEQLGLQVCTHVSCACSVLNMSKALPQTSELGDGMGEILSLLIVSDDVFKGIFFLNETKLPMETLDVITRH